MMKLPKILLALPIVGFVLSSYAIHPYAEQLEAAKEQSSRVRYALQANFDQKKAIAQDLDTLATFIQSKAEGVSVPDLLDKMKGRLTKEQTNLTLYEALLAPLEGGVTVTWSQKYQKMALAIQDILTSYLTEETLTKVLAGRHLFDTSLTEDSFPSILTSTSTLDSPAFWGTTKVARYSLFLMAVSAQLQDLEGKSPVTGVAALNAAGIKIDEAPIAHIVPLPNIFDTTVTSWDKYLRGSLFLVEDYLDGRPGFLLPGEFQFGGHRNVDETSSLEPRYRHGKRFGPHDGSSIIAAIFEYPHLFATLYQSMFFFSQQAPETYEGYLTKMSVQAASDVREKVAQLSEHFDAINIADVKPGDIIGYRTPNAANPAMGPGHTGLFIGYTPEGDSIIFGANRGLPQNQMDGIGLEVKKRPDTAIPFAMRSKEKAAK